MGCGTALKSQRVATVNLMKGTNMDLRELRSRILERVQTDVSKERCKFLVDQLLDICEDYAESVCDEAYDAGHADGYDDGYADGYDESLYEIPH